MPPPTILRGGEVILTAAGAAYRVDETGRFLQQLRIKKVGEE